MISITADRSDKKKRKIKKKDRKKEKKEKKRKEKKKEKKKEEITAKGYDEGEIRKENWKKKGMFGR